MLTRVGMMKAIHLGKCLRTPGSNCMLQTVWYVRLHGDHPAYAWIKLKRQLQDDLNYVAVIVDARKFMDCYMRDMQAYVLPPVEQWEPGKKTGIWKFLNPHLSGVPAMPRVSFAVVERKRLWGLRPSIYEGVASFTNGRHRSMYMAFAGATSFPVEVHVNQASLLKRYCGIEESHDA